MTKISKTERMRVSWEVPAFKDNYDPHPKIRSTRLTGSYFYYGKTKVVYTAIDGSGNEATCQFYVIIKGMKVALRIQVRAHRTGGTSLWCPGL